MEMKNFFPFPLGQVIKSLEKDLSKNNLKDLTFGKMFLKIYFSIVLKIFNQM